MDRIKALMLAACVGVLTFAAAPAFAQVKLRIGWAPSSDQHAFAVAGNALKRLIEEQTKGAIQVQTFCCLKLGDEQEMVKKVQAGTLDATIVAQNNIGPFFPLMDTFALPYVFRDYAHAVKVLEGPIGKELSDKAAKQAGFELISSASIALRNIYNSKRPIESIKDVPGLRYRVPPNPVTIATYKAFGADPTPVPWAETLTATQTGVVDGGDLEPTAYYLYRFAEVAKNMAFTEHFTLIAPIVIGRHFLDKLTPEQQSLVRAAAFKAAKTGQEAELENQKGIVEKLEKTMNVKFTHPDKAPFIAASAKVRESFASERGKEFADLMKAIEDTK